MSSPATAARTALIDLLVDEFAADSFAVRSSRLDASLGHDGGVIGVSPLREMPNPSNRWELWTTLQVQFFAPWTPQTDPNEAVDPTPIEAWAWRFRQMIDQYQQTGTSDVWWFQLDTLDYGTDPTGNSTRFTAQVTARGENPTG